MGARLLSDDCHKCNYHVYDNCRKSEQLLYDIQRSRSLRIKKQALQV